MQTRVLFLKFVTETGGVLCIYSLNYKKKSFFKPQFFLLFYHIQFIQISLLNNLLYKFGIFVGELPNRIDENMWNDSTSGSLRVIFDVLPSDQSTNPEIVNATLMLHLKERVCK